MGGRLDEARLQIAYDLHILRSDVAAACRQLALAACRSILSREWLELIGCHGRGARGDVVASISLSPHTLIGGALAQLSISINRIAMSAIGLPARGAAARRVAIIIARRGGRRGIARCRPNLHVLWDASGGFNLTISQVILSLAVGCVELMEFDVIRLTLAVELLGGGAHLTPGDSERRNGEREKAQSIHHREIHWLQVMVPKSR